MGVITFERVLQSGSADVIYARGINRIRHLYLEYAPQMRPYFILSTHDDREGIVGQEGMHASWWQTFFNTAAMIAVINTPISRKTETATRLTAKSSPPKGRSCATL